MTRAVQKTTHILFILALLALASLATIHFCTATTHTLVYAMNNGFADTPIFVTSALKFLQTGTLYDMREPLAITYAPGAETYKFPPLYVLPYLPWLNRESGIPLDMYNIFSLIHIVRYIVTLILCILFFGGKNPAWALTVIIIYCFAGPFYESLYGLTFDSLLLTSLTIALILKNHKIINAALITHAILAKLYPAPLLLYFLKNHSVKKSAAILIAVTATIAIVPIIIMGIEVHKIYFIEILPIIIKEETLLSDYNLSFISLLNSKGIPDIFCKAFILLASILVILSARKNSSAKNIDELVFGFCISLTILLIPNCWGNYQLILIMPVIILLGHAWNSVGLARATATLIAIAAWLPMTSSANYPSLKISYMEFIPTNILENIIYLRHFSALILWAGVACILLTPTTQPIKSNPPTLAMGKLSNTYRRP